MKYSIIGYVVIVAKSLVNEGVSPPQSRRIIMHALTETLREKVPKNVPDREEFIHELEELALQKLVDEGIT